MTLDRFLLWQLEVLRETLVLAAPRVSLGFVFWWKEPGNAYTTFYPTAWLPSPDDLEASASIELGMSIFRRAMNARGTTIANYMGEELVVPAWPRESDKPLAPITMADFPDPKQAAQIIVRRINIRWLRAHGDVSPTVSAAVHTWLDRIIEHGHTAGAKERSTDFDRNQLPRALWLMEIYDPSVGGHVEHWWPGYEPRVPY